jgi:hypothetical protein
LSILVEPKADGILRFRGHEISLNVMKFRWQRRD